MRGTGEQLKKLRKSCGLTVAKAAALAWTPKRTWECWEQRPGTSGAASPPGIVFVFLLQLKESLLQKAVQEGDADPDYLESFYEEKDEYRRLLEENRGS